MYTIVLVGQEQFVTGCVQYSHGCLCSFSSIEQIGARSRKEDSAALVCHRFCGSFLIVHFLGSSDWFLYVSSFIPPRLAGYSAHFAKVKVINSKFLDLMMV